MKCEVCGAEMRRIYFNELECEDICPREFYGEGHETFLHRKMRRLHELFRSIVGRAKESAKAVVRA